MMTRYYKVAGHTFAVSGQAELFEQMGNYEPFECEGGEPLFSLTADCGVIPEYTEVFRLGEGGHIIFGNDASGNEVYDVTGRMEDELNEFLYDSDEWVFPEEPELECDWDEED